MEDVEMSTEKNSNVDQDADPTFLTAYDEEKKEYIIQISISNNQLIFEIILNSNDNNLHYNKYIYQNSFDELKQNIKIFSTYQSLLDIKNFFKQFENIVNIKYEKYKNSYSLTFPTSSKIQNELTFDLIPEEKSESNLKEEIKQLLNDKKKLEEEKEKIQQQIVELENELTKAIEEKQKTISESMTVKEERNLFLGEDTYYIVSAINSNKCLDVKPLDGCWKLMINDFIGNNSQKFLISTDNKLEHYIYFSKDKDKILDIDIKKNKEINNETQLIITENLNGEKSQKWLFAKKDDYIYIKSCAYANRVIEIPNNETFINLRWYNGNENQLWKFIKA